MQVQLVTLFQGEKAQVPQVRGGGRKEATGGEKKVRLGLVGMGVPSSSSRTCGGGVVGEEEERFFEGVVLRAAEL